MELSLPFIFPISILFQINETVRSTMITPSPYDSEHHVQIVYDVITLIL